jgi:hypothetical protein
MFDLSIETNNAAFSDGAMYEIARILRELADKIEHSEVEDYPYINLRDYNGNIVGVATNDME